MFPEVTGRSGGVVTTNENLFSITLPTGIVTDEMLLVVIGVDGSDQQTVGGGSSPGWLRAGFGPSAFNDGVLSVFVKIANDSNTLNVSNGSNESCAWNSFRIANHRGTTGDIFLAFSSDSTVNAQPPPLSPALGEADYLWLVGATSGWGAGAATAPPTGFGDFVMRRAGTAANHGNIATAELIDKVASKSPSAFTSPDEDWTALTIAIPGLSGPLFDNGAILSFI